MFVISSIRCIGVDFIAPVMIKIQLGRLTLDDTPLKIEEQQTYLGVTFDKRMTWKQLRLGEK
jgi:hypothetical protein